MPPAATRNQGKSLFVREMLNDEPYADARAVNAAWQAVGMPIRIVSGLVNNLRFLLGQSGNMESFRSGAMAPLYTRRADRSDLSRGG